MRTCWSVSQGVGFYCFFFNDTATTEIYTLSLHDALPISLGAAAQATCALVSSSAGPIATAAPKGRPDRKSTRLNSSHANISYAVFCLKKKRTMGDHRYELSKPFLPLHPDRSGDTRVAFGQ